MLRQGVISVETLKPGIDYTLDAKGRFIFTAHYLRQRGYCCDNGCQNCPYRFKLAPMNAPFWAANGHTQTLAGHFISSASVREKMTTERIPLADGDSLIAEWRSPNQSGAEWIIAFHGLGGSSQADYMRRLANIAIGLGWGVCLVNHRGAGAGKGLAKRPYHSGSGDDVSSAIAWLRQRSAGAKITAVGFSLSGSALLNLLAGRRGQDKPDRAIVVNAPLELESAAQLLAQGWNRLYDIRFVKLVRESIRSRKSLGVEMPRELKKWWRLRLFELDDLYTAPAIGLRDRFHYYEECSSFAYLHKITTPLFMLTSADDPFVAIEHYQRARLSESTQLHIESVGGHMGYISRSLETKWQKRWLDYALSEILQKWQKKTG